MTKRLVEIDDAELQRARDSGDYATIKDTVSAALRELAAQQARRREIVRLGSGLLSPLVDKAERRDAWR